ncbi:glutathione peroxidase [Tritrichomonas foetus]|uniref:Glutathione peroxidase n=1 Tax=Tritrichomonas foetus TaxID=1144522 RepID=A0A1J4J9Y9_9EUKA|nr:glutathione peroxidase [Tritrichomonas foetus]|eukprot:OHS94068.1 glutathione peroxidase [Tritrichomonas foetus]
MGLGHSDAEPQFTSIYDIPLKTIKGQDTTLAEYKGKVIMIVNIAGKCGFTPQLKGLEQLYQDKKDQGFVILGFPANDFMHQEPRSNDEIASSCSLNYGVTFPLFEKIVVRGHEQHQLFAYLISPKTNPKFSGEVSWNFNKFLISRKGEIINRFGSKQAPEDKDVIKCVDDAIKEPAE